MPVGATKTASHGKLRRPCIIVCMQIRHHGFFYGLGKTATAAGGLSRTGRGATPLQTSPRVFEHFSWQSREKMGRMLQLHIQDVGDKPFVQVEENAWGRAAKDCVRLKNIPRAFLVARATLLRFAGAFYNWGYYCVVPIFRDLGRLE